MSDENNIRRRDFLKSTPLVLGGIGVLTQQASANDAQTPVTVGEVIDRVLALAGDVTIEDTIDTIKVGYRDRHVRRIVTTFMATTEIIEHAIEHKADFIITHEPTFYSHNDATEWLKDDAVYKHKLALLEDNGITVWRYHDHLHKIVPDPIFTGLFERLGWADLIDPDDGRVCHIPQTTLGDLARHCKQQLNIDALNYVGDPALPCKNIGILPGAWGGKPQIGFLAEGNIDVLICGEVAEWETNIYAKDSQHTSKPVGLIVTGHQASEEDGMKLLAGWLTKQYPELLITHLPAGDTFRHV